MTNIAVRRAQIAARAQGEIGSLLTADIATQFREAVVAAGNQIRNRQLPAMAEVFRRPQTDTARRTGIHERLGSNAQVAIIEAYDEMVVGTEGPASATHYRAGLNRLAGGVLRRALANPRNIYTAYADGLSFINQDGLYREAAHWHRIAFGAGARGRGAHSSYTVRFGNLVAASIGIIEEPSAEFKMPPGMFYGVEDGKGVPPSASRRGQDVFFPNAQKARDKRPGVRWVPHKQRARKFGYVGGMRTQGIRGENFFDAGVAVIANEFPLAYEQYYRDLFNEASRRLASGPFARLEVRAPRPTRRVWSAAVEQMLGSFD